MEKEISFADIQLKAKELGWDDVGITSPSIPEEDILSYLSWLKQGYHGNLKYMENQMRSHPEQFFPEAKTAILFISFYKQEKILPVPKKGLIASYARGKDYHHIHRKRIKKFISWLEEKSGEKNIARGFSDSAPLLEKALAVQAGLGWFGKNTLLIHRKFGTFILLSGILTSLEFYQEILPTRIPRCGSCTRCLDACPTQAFISPYHLDAQKCLSYHLIESKNEIPKEIQKKNPGYIFGCDICQDVCPHNIKKSLSTHREFAPENGIGIFIDEEKMAELEEKPEKLFGTPLQRRGVQNLKYSLHLLKEPERKNHG